MMTAAKEEVYGALYITANKRVEFLAHLSDAEAEAASWCIADDDRIVSQLQREIYSIPSKEQMSCKKELYIRMIEFETWRQAIRLQELQNTIKQDVIIFSNPKMHLMSHISQSIWQMCSGNNSTTNISEWLHIGNVKDTCPSTHRLNYI
jgi:hypothetical protein